MSAIIDAAVVSSSEATLVEQQQSRLGGKARASDRRLCWRAKAGREMPALIRQACLVQRGLRFRKRDARRQVRFSKALRQGSKVGSWNTMASGSGPRISPSKLCQPADDAQQVSCRCEGLEIAIFSPSAARSVCRAGAQLRRKPCADIDRDMRSPTGSRGAPRVQRAFLDHQHHRMRTAHRPAPCRLEERNRVDL